MKNHKFNGPHPTTRAEFLAVEGPRKKLDEATTNKRFGLGEAAIGLVIAGGALLSSEATDIKDMDAGLAVAAAGAVIAGKGARDVVRSHAEQQQALQEMHGAINVEQNLIQIPEQEQK